MIEFVCFLELVELLIVHVKYPFQMETATSSAVVSDRAASTHEKYPETDYHRGHNESLRLQEAGYLTSAVSYLW